MTTRGTDHEDPLLTHAERQTKALENIQFAIWLLFLAAVIALVVGLAGLF